MFNVYKNQQSRQTGGRNLMGPKTLPTVWGTYMTFHRCFLTSFGSFGQAVSEEKILKNRPIRNKNYLWRPCLLMDRDEMSKLYGGPSINASYQVSVHLAKEFQRRLKCEKLTNDRRRTTDAK